MHTLHKQNLIAVYTYCLLRLMYALSYCVNRNETHFSQCVSTTAGNCMSKADCGLDICVKNILCALGNI